MSLKKEEEEGYWAADGLTRVDIPSSTLKAGFLPLIRASDVTVIYSQPCPSFTCLHIILSPTKQGR